MLPNKPIGILISVGEMERFLEGIWKFVDLEEIWAVDTFGPLDGGESRYMDLVRSFIKV